MKFSQVIVLFCMLYLGLTKQKRRYLSWLSAFCVIKESAF